MTLIDSLNLKPLSFIENLIGFLLHYSTKKQTGGGTESIIGSMSYEILDVWQNDKREGTIRT